MLAPNLVIAGRPVKANSERSDEAHDHGSHRESKTVIRYFALGDHLSGIADCSGFCPMSPEAFRRITQQIDAPSLEPGITVIF